MAQAGSSCAASRNARKRLEIPEAMQQGEPLVKPSLRLRRGSGDRKMTVPHARNHHRRRQRLSRLFTGIGMHMGHLRDTRSEVS